MRLKELRAVTRLVAELHILDLRPETMWTVKPIESANQGNKVRR
jgi:hypothetical protein